MSVQPPGKGWNVLGAIFLIVGGLLLVSIGGVCSYFLAPEVLRSGGGNVWIVLLISLGTLAAGFSLIYQAVKMLRR